LVVVLQDSLDLLNGELGSSSGRGVRSTVIEAERVTDVTETENQQQITVSVITTENNVSCAPVVSAIYILWAMSKIACLYIGVCV
jgi:hypothetical protein